VNLASFRNITKEQIKNPDNSDGKVKISDPIDWQQKAKSGIHCKGCSYIIENMNPKGINPDNPDFTVAKLSPNRLSDNIQKLGCHSLIVPP
jgi:hypothetical protein